MMGATDVLGLTCGLVLEEGFPRVDLERVVTSIAETIHTVFRYTLPFGVLAFLLSLTLPHVTLKGRGSHESPAVVPE